MEVKGTALKISLRRVRESTAASSAPQLLRGRKQAEATLSTAQRKAMPKSAFAIPEKAPGPGSYPIGDLEHARKALQLSGGKPEEARVRAAVYKKWPQLKQSREADPGLSPDTGTLDSDGAPTDVLDSEGTGTDVLNDDGTGNGVSPDGSEFALAEPGSPCPLCGGTGEEGDDNCRWCGGTGKVQSDGDDDGDAGGSGGSSLRDALESQRFREVAAVVPAKSGSAYEVVMMEEGIGNPADKNFYTKQYLKRMVESGKLEGMRAYSDHASKSQERDLPERSVKQLAGYYRKVRYRESGGSGQVVGEFVPTQSATGLETRALIESALQHAEDAPGAKPLLGVSMHGEMLGRWGQHPVHGRVFYAEEPTSPGSADIVTTPGAGGRFTRRISESLRQAIGAEPSQHKGDHMKPDELQKAFATIARKMRESIATINKGAQEGASDDEATAAAEGLQALATYSRELEELESKQVEATVREVEVPATSDDEIKRKVREAEDRASSAQGRAEQLEQENRDLKAENDTHTRAALVTKVLRESKVGDDLRDLYAPDMAKLRTEEEMRAYVERERKREEAIVARVRESSGYVEGAGVRLPDEVDTSGADWLRQQGIPVRQQPEQAAA